MKKILILLLVGLQSYLIAQSNYPPIESSLEGAGTGSFLVENCGDYVDSIVFTIDPQPSEWIYNVSIAGSAELGIDYDTEVPDMLAFGENTAQLAFPISVISDMEMEDRETIEITVSDQSGTVLTTYTILILDEIEVNIEPSTVEVCQGDSVTLSTVIAGEYAWIYGDDTIVAPELSFTADEELSVMVLASYGDCNAQDEVDISLSAGITFNGGDTSYICLGETATVTVDVVGDPAGDYQWSPMDSTLTVLSDQAIQVNTDVTRTYYLSFTNSACSIMDSVVVRVDSIPELPLTVVPDKESYCPGEIVTIFPRYLFPGDFPDIEYMWTFDAGTAIRGDTLKSFVLSTEDTSYFRLMTTNNACMRTDSVLLNVINPPVNLSVTDTTVCPNNPVTVELLNADDFDEIMWSPEEGLSCTDCPDPTIRTETSMTYTMTGMSMGCPASGSVNVNIFPPDFINVGPDTVVCPGSPVQLFALEAAEYENLVWTGDGLECTNCDSPIAVPGGPTNYQVNGTKPDGCTGIGSINLQTFTVPNVFVSTDPMGEIEVGSTIEVVASTTPDVSSTGDFTWMANGADIAPTGPVIMTTVPSEGDNEFKVTVISPDGCMSMGTGNITGTPPKYEIPSAFTPTGDDLNDNFKVLIFGNIRLAELKVFNRWGQLVYEGTDEDGWDGYHNGKESPADVYAYSAVLELLDGTLQMVRGEVALIR